MIIQSWPPNIDQIRAVLPVSEKNIFAYGGKIYSPSTSELPPWLVAHEQIHFEQQGRWPARWWKKFLRDEEFRLDQELEAHRVEWAAFCVLNQDRNTRSLYLSGMARRLAAPMYGGIITAREAKREITNGSR